jgi:hypothetical protein
MSLFFVVFFFQFLQASGIVQYNLGNPAARYSDTSSNPASGARQASATLCRFLQAAEAVLQYTFHTAVDLMCAEDIQF